MEKQDIILHVDHMTKCFGDLKVLNDISFDVHRGVVFMYRRTDWLWKNDLFKLYHRAL